MKKIIILIIAICLFSPVNPAFAQQKKDTMNALYDEGVALYQAAQYQKAIEKFEQGLSLARRKKDSRAVAVFIGNLGVVYANIGEYKKVIECYEEALLIKRELRDKKGEASVLTNLGALYDELESYDKAIVNYKEALKIFRGFKDQKGIHTNVSNLGIIYNKLGDYQKAIVYYNESLKIAKEIKDQKGIENTLTNLGIAYKNIGKYQKALEYYEEALKTAQELNDKKAVGDIYNNMSLLFNNLGDLNEAVSYCTKSLEIRQESGDKKGLSDSLSNLGLFHKNLGEYKLAEDNYKKSLKIKEEIGVGKEQVQANLADIYLEQGDIKKAEKVYLELGDPVRLGCLYLAKKNFVAALKYFDISLKDSMQHRNARLFFAGYCGLGAAYLGLKEYSSARKNFEKAIFFNEEQRESLGEDERSRFFLDKVQGFYRSQPYEGMVELLVNTGDQPGAFFYSENLKARILAEAIVKGRRNVAKSLTKKLAEEEKSYLTSIQILRTLMHTAYMNQETEVYESLEKQLKKEKSKQEKFIAKLRDTYPEYASLSYPNPIHPSELALEKNEVLVEFEITKDKTYVFLLQGKKVKVREVKVSRKELKNLVMEYRSYFEGIATYKDLLDYNPETGQKLYTLLFWKMLGDLPKGTQIIIVPDEFLGILPFESLVVSREKRNKVGEGEYGPFPLGIKYLGDKFSISYAQSATSLALLRSSGKKEVSGNKVLVVCDPVFSGTDKRLDKGSKQGMGRLNIKKMEAIKTWRDMGVKGLKKEASGKKAGHELFPRLAKTRELVKISRLLFADDSVVYSGDRAKEENLVILDFKEYKYLIFATHGILDNTVPWIKEPSLVLTQVGNHEKFDGFLSMSEIMALRIPSEVVMLVACQTGVGENIRGEGVMGLGRAFQYSGCDNVVMSLWSVAEDATVFMSKKYLENLKEGKTPKQALYLAKQAMRHAGFEHPFYWSSFILVSK